MVIEYRRNIIMSYPGQIPAVYPYIPPPYIHPPTSTPIITPPTTVAVAPNTTDSSKYSAFDRPITTVFVGDISDKIPDTLMKEILTKCGNVLSWKRVQVASSYKAFGFCEYDNPEATLRCIRLLNEYKIADKSLKVKVDPKTDELLTEYKTKKQKAIEERESEDISKSEEARKEKINSIYAKETEEDKNVLKQIKKLISDSGLEFSENDKGKKSKNESVKKLKIEDVDESDKNDIINKEIEIFRSRHKDDEINESEERYKRMREREKEKAKEKEKERSKEKRRRRKSKSRSKSKAKSGDDSSRLKSKVESKDSSSPKKRRSGSKETHRSSKRKKEDKDVDEYEAAILKKYERKLRDKEAAYQKRLQAWEVREKKKQREYEMEITRKVQKDKEISEEARKLQIFFEDYDDEKCDLKYYRGAELERRLNARRIEEVSDDRDKAKELEQIENTRQRLIKEQNPNVDDIISKMEQSMREHLQRKLMFENKTEKLPVKSEEDHVSNHIEKSEAVKSDDNNDDNSPKLLQIGNENEIENEIENENENEIEDENDKDNDNDTDLPVESEKPLENLDESDEVTALINTKEEKIENSEEYQGIEVPTNNLDSKPLLPNVDRKLLVKQIIDNIPTLKADLFAYSIDWEMVNEEFVENRIKPWVKKKIVGYIGEDEPSLSQFICDQVLHHKTPDQILADIAMVLEEEADVFVMKMWRLLIYVIEEKKSGLDK